MSDLKELGSPASDASSSHTVVAAGSNSPQGVSSPDVSMASLSPDRTSHITADWAEQVEAEFELDVPTSNSFQALSGIPASPGLSGDPSQEVRYRTPGGSQQPSLAGQTSPIRDVGPESRLGDYPGPGQPGLTQSGPDIPEISPGKAQSVGPVPGLGLPGSGSTEIVMVSPGPKTKGKGKGKKTQPSTSKGNTPPTATQGQQSRQQDSSSAQATGGADSSAPGPSSVSPGPPSAADLLPEGMSQVAGREVLSRTRRGAGAGPYTPTAAALAQTAKKFLPRWKEVSYTKQLNARICGNPELMPSRAFAYFERWSGYIRVGGKVKCPHCDGLYSCSKYMVRHVFACHFPFRVRLACLQ